MGGWWAGEWGIYDDRLEETRGSKEANKAGKVLLAEASFHSVERSN